MIGTLRNSRDKMKNSVVRGENEMMKTKGTKKENLWKLKVRKAKTRTNRQTDQV